MYHYINFICTENFLHIERISEAIVAIFFKQKYHKQTVNQKLFHVLKMMRCSFRLLIEIRPTWPPSSRATSFPAGVVVEHSGHIAASPPSHLVGREPSDRDGEAGEARREEYGMIASCFLHADQARRSFCLPSAIQPTWPPSVRAMPFPTDVAARRGGPVAPSPQPSSGPQGGW